MKDAAMKDITGYTSMIYGSGAKRYSAAARTLHWVTALLIFAIVPLGWIFAEFKTKGKPPTGFEAPIPGTPFAYASVHKTIGLTIFVLVLARIVYRFVNRPPVLPGTMAPWEKGLAHASHWLLYLTLIVMPVSGYIMSSSGKNPISILGLVNFPKLPIAKETGDVAKEIHLFTQYALYALVIAHIGAIVWHLAVRRDGVLDRMLPKQANAE